MDIDYYKVLEVSEDATADEIKSSYRKMAMKYHPDRNKGDAEAESRFKACSIAWETLGDAEKKAQYDLKRKNTRIPPLNMPFGATRYNGGRYPQRGADIEVQMPLTMSEVYKGASKHVRYNREVNCELCNGEGLAPGKKKTPCAPCRATGYVDTATRNMRVRQPCGSCRTTGQRIAVEDACTGCKGLGRVARAETLDVNIPVGVHTGQAMGFEMMGHAGMYGGPFGDVVIFFNVKHDPQFERRGNDVHSRTVVPMTLLVLGGEIDIPSLPDLQTIRVKVPAESHDGLTLRLEGRGVPSPKTGKDGDMFVRLSASYPVSLTDKQKELLQEFQRLEREKQDVGEAVRDKEDRESCAEVS